MTAKIIGTGSYCPKSVVNNDFLSSIVETDDEWIQSRTGIRERRITSGEGTASLGVKASLEAIKDSKVDPLDIDLIIVATMSGDCSMPSTACEIQKEINATNAVCFDLNAACTGFLFAINTAYAYINAGLYTTALVIGSETLSKLIDWSDRGTCVLFGDGAGAVIIKKASEGIIDIVMGSDGSKKDVLTCGDRKINNPFIKSEDKLDFIKMEGQEVFKFAVKKVPECILELLEKSDTKVEEIKYFVLHQANKRILQSVAKRLKVSEDKMPINLDRYGNTSSASIPILLDELNREGRLKEGDKIVLSGFGGGLTWGACLLKW